MRSTGRSSGKVQTISLKMTVVRATINHPAGQEGTTTYTATFSINDLSVTVESSRPIDEEKVTRLLEQVLFEEITYDEMVAQLKAMGYRVV